MGRSCDCSVSVPSRVVHAVKKTDRRHSAPPRHVRRTSPRRHTHRIAPHLSIALPIASQRRLHSFNSGDLTASNDRWLMSRSALHWLNPSCYVTVRCRLISCRSCQSLHIISLDSNEKVIYVPMAWRYVLGLRTPGGSLSTSFQARDSPHTASVSVSFTR